MLLILYKINWYCVSSYHLLTEKYIKHDNAILLLGEKWSRRLSYQDIGVLGKIAETTGKQANKTS
jgi:hypothetical protein